jgi:hypothetical protein
VSLSEDFTDFSERQVKNALEGAKHAFVILGKKSGSMSSGIDDVVDIVEECS